MSDSKEFLSWNDHLNLLNEAKTRFQYTLDLQLERFVRQLTKTLQQPFERSSPVRSPPRSVSPEHEVPRPKTTKAVEPKCTSPNITKVTSVVSKMMKTAAPSTSTRKQSRKATLESNVHRSNNDVEELDKLQQELESLRQRYQQLSSEPLPEQVPGSDDNESLKVAEAPISPPAAAAPAYVSSFQQRRATLAAFRKASLAAVTRTSGAEKPIEGKPIPLLNSGNADVFFGDDKRSKTFEDIDHSTDDAELLERVAEVDILKKMRSSATAETKLFHEMIEVMIAVQEQDKVDLEQAVVRQRMKLQATDAQLSKIVTTELARMARQNEKASHAPKVKVLEVDSKNEEPSDADSSDSEVLNVGRDVELTRMPDGSIRISVGSQAEILSDENDFDREVISTALKFVTTREHAIKASMEEMTTILRNLERCDEALEPEVVCSACKQLLSELFILWPCGHHFCLDCIYDNERPSGGYCCTDCRSVTADMPVPNLAVNDFAARMSFKRSGFHDLFDVLNRFRKEVNITEGDFVATTANIYKVIDGAECEFKTFDDVAAPRHVQ